MSMTDTANKKTRKQRKEAEAGDFVRNKFNSISPASNAIITVVLSLLSLLMIVPMLLVIIISFSSNASIADVGFSFFPEEWSLEGYQYLFKMGEQVLDSYIITIFYTVVGTVMSLSVMSLFAYVIAQKNFPARGAFTWMLFFTMLFSGGLVPSYILNVRYLNMYDTVWVFLLPSLVSAYNVIILRTFIQTTIPDTLFEAAKIDGAGHWRIFAQIVLPLFKAGLATIGLFNIVGRWNDWFTGMLYIDNAKLVPIQTLLQKIQSQMDFLKNNSAITGTPEGIQMMRNLPTQSLRMACVVIIVLPILCAYPFFQRYFVSGLTIGSVKG